MNTAATTIPIPQQHTPPSLEGYASNSFSMGDSYNSPGRRQRISMACQYCRHRKIRCCGGAPCRNCTRSKRECEYAPVPEEVNRATREKKAVAKAAKASTHYVTPATTSSPYYIDHRYEGMYASPVAPSGPYGPPRSLSMPIGGVSASSGGGSWGHGGHMGQATFESPQWMYGEWGNVPLPPTSHSGSPHVRVSSSGKFPSVLEQTPAHSAYLSNQLGVSLHHGSTASPSISSGPSGRSSSADSDGRLSSAWSTPNLLTPIYMRPATSTPSKPLPVHHHSSHHVPSHHPPQPQAHHSPPTPNSITFPSPLTTPPLYSYPYAAPPPRQPIYYSPPSSSGRAEASPTLAPEMGMPGKEGLVGLGLMEGEYLHGSAGHEEYFAHGGVQF
ncbi:hypothetical protein IAT38_001924 [Cryptococcus sp. DSM 104549]